MYKVERFKLLRSMVNPIEFHWIPSDLRARLYAGEIVFLAAEELSEEYAIEREALCRFYREEKGMELFSLRPPVEQTLSSIFWLPLEHLEKLS
ncbi:MAG: hypothetical protein ACLFNK_03965 [Candidatus Woesearchaeota archaeon]